MSTATSKLNDIFKGITGPVTSALNTVATTVKGAAPSLLGTTSTAATTTTTTSPFSAATTTGWGATIGRIAGYLFSILLVTAIVLLFVHYFITPIIQERPGAPGYIYLGTDDGILYWEKGNTTVLVNKQLPIASMYYDYTLNLDIFIQDPIPYDTTPRILMTRGAVYKEPPTKGPTLTSVLDKYNLAIALQPNTNDLIVSVLNKNNNQEDLILTNVPVQKTFRLTVAVMQKSLEAYVNGRLVKTRTFSADLLDQRGDISVSAIKEDVRVAKMKNLKIWSHLLRTPEIRGASPPMPTDDQMGGLPLPSMSICSTA